MHKPLNKAGVNPIIQEIRDNSKPIKLEEKILIHIEEITLRTDLGVHQQTEIKEQARISQLTLNQEEIISEMTISEDTRTEIHFMTLNKQAKLD